ncbi:MAG: TatD family hydrolase [Fimbriimonadaceae bacterium]|nr:TatD family hydrolase [Fimbriimonadaceae bacterium]
MRLIDTHCHLNDPQAFPDPAKAIREAVDAGVSDLIVVGIDLEWSRRAVELAETHPEVWAVVGRHPSHAHEAQPGELTELERLARHPRCVAVGEIGLDFHWDFSTPEQQHRVLADLLDLAETVEKPVVFHCRDAYPDLLDVLEKRRRLDWIFHCFSGGKEDARRAEALGAWFGIDGPVTYPKNVQYRELIADLPRDRVVIETDAPWLSPAPHRGKRNRPAWLPHVNEGLAQAWNCSPEESAAATSANAVRFFRLPK